MSNDASQTSAAAASALPRPQIELIAGKTALPADGGELDAILKVTVAFPPVAVDRKPLNLALVIDRSGSMSGPPIEAARTAAHTAVGMLLPGDWVSVVTFDSQVDTLVPLTKVEEDRQAILDAIAGVGPRGSTDLYGGWAEGLSQLLSCPEADVVSRVVILSDGCANQGVTDLRTIASDVGQAVTHGVTTTTMGLAAHYDENLLRTVADAGNGNYVFLEGAEQVIEAFEHELAGLGALRGRNVTLAASGQGVGIRRHAADRSRSAAAVLAHQALRLPDLIAGLPLELAVVLTLAKGAAEPVLTLSWDDAITRTRDEEHLQLQLPSLDAAAFAALPSDQRVAEYTLALEIAAAKLDLGEIARTGDMLRARQALIALRALVDRLPAGHTQTQERQELAELEHRIERSDGAMTARYSEKFARARLYGRTDDNLKAMAAREADHRSQKQASIAAHKARQAGAGGALGAASGDSGQARAVGGRQFARSAAPVGTVMLSERIARPGGKPVTLELVQGDITDQAVDVIVNSTNRGLFGSAGVDGAIHRRAGPGMTAATQAIGNIGYGEAVFTSGYDLPAQYVVHVATPAWGSTGRELQLLAQCYESAFALAARLGARSLAFPAIGTGTYQYPLTQALEVAASVVTPWLTTKGEFEVVRFVVVDAAVGRA